MAKWKTNPISESLHTSKVPSILARLLHERRGLIVFLWWSWLINHSCWKQLSLAKMWSAYLGMTQMCLFYLNIEWIGQTCNAIYRWGTGVDQYMTSMPSVLIMVRNACSHYVCMRSVVVRHLPTLRAKEMPQATRHSATVMVDRIAWIHSLQPGKFPNHLKRTLWNRLHWQQPSKWFWWWSWIKQWGWRCSWRPNFGPYGCVGKKDKEIKETLYFIFCLFCRSFCPIHLSVISFLIFW